jgi:hypothetical protein
MCRNIKTLFNFEPAATEDEIQASALQFVRKLSGFNAPSKANEAAFALAVAEFSASARKLLISLQTNAPARDRKTEAEQGEVRLNATTSPAAKHCCVTPSRCLGAAKPARTQECGRTTGTKRGSLDEAR